MIGFLMCLIGGLLVGWSFITDAKKHYRFAFGYIGYAMAIIGQHI